ncbi:helix-turn-helix transcriptional regulator [Bacillus sp. ISL-75]|uniref:helix-turn-helix transcriptional regulator n=1 Tax=Bacillus sp. ISL-75 TaxID=2819137 RepID=UPI001BEAFE7E|nr:helix-turn-helix transcriptional regulator [Bacillus sp. ISL-75]
MNELFKDEIDKLKAYMAVLDLNQTELGEKLGVSQSLISLILKRQHKPTFELNQKINNLINGY